MSLLNPSYPNSALLDAVIERCHLKNDAALARLLGLTPSAISNVRNGRRVPGPQYIIKAHEVTGIPIRELKRIVNLPCLSSWSQATREPSDLGGTMHDKRRASL